ncbi:hypothetical protein D3C85_329760 [compost metagenome]
MSCTVSTRMSRAAPSSMRRASICSRPLPVPAPPVATRPGGVRVPFHTSTSVWMRATLSASPQP